MSGEPSWLALSLVRAGSPGLPTGRAFLISIPKKAIRLATKRNRVRRVLREALRSIEPPAGFVYRFRVTAFPQEATLVGARAEVKKALSKSGTRQRPA